MNKKTVVQGSEGTHESTVAIVARFARGKGGTV